MALVLAMILGGCADAPRHSVEENSPLLRLSLPPESLGRSLWLSQLLTARVGTQEQSFRFEAEVSPERLVIVGLTHMGAPLFTLTEDDDAMNVETIGDGQLPFNPRYMLADFKLTYWPANVLRRALAPLGLRLEQSPDGLDRRVVAGDANPLVNIAYPRAGANAGEIMVNHYDYPYRLHIKTIRKEGRP